MKTPTDPAVRKLHDWIDSHKDEMVSALQGALRIPSVEGYPEPGAPYGAKVREALDYTLALTESLGFRTRNIDGHAGDAEFGKGDAYIGAIGHLDVVPEGDGWSKPPYGAVLEGGYLYSRGASDDKGPTYAALFGAKALLDSQLPLSRRVRLIFGCNEESGFGCVHHYFDVAKEERPLYAFTPDASFPLIYAEKGIANIVLEQPYPERSEGVRIAMANGGRRPNMVPDYAEATLAGPQSALVNLAMELDSFWDRNVHFRSDSDTLTIMSTGKSAHGSSPTAGDNAIARLARTLISLGLAEQAPWAGWILSTVDPYGCGLGIAGKDDVAGQLTSNLGIMEFTDEGNIRLTYNIRYPVTWKSEQLTELGSDAWQKGGWNLKDLIDQPPLFVPLDQEPVSTLLRVYREETGDETSQPGTMGGGTYARATPRAVAFGASFPDSSDGPAHEPDERFAVDTYLNAAKIFAHALYELAK